MPEALKNQAPVLKPTRMSTAPATPMLSRFTSFPAFCFTCALSICMSNRTQGPARESLYPPLFGQAPTNLYSDDETPVEPQQRLPSQGPRPRGCFAHGFGRLRALG